MKRILPYPLLLIIAFVFDQATTLMLQLNPVQSLRLLFVMLFLGAIFSLVIQCFVKDWHRTDFMLFVLVFLYISYTPIYRTIARYLPDQASYLGIVLIFFLGLLYAILVNRNLWQYVPRPDQITHYFGLICALLLIFQIARLGTDFYIQTSVTKQSNAISALAKPIHLKSDLQPDIYIIILDGYGRQDVLQSMYDLDNSGFVDELEKRGFYVPTNNHSNYIQTTYAMASFWNFDYLQPWTESSDYAKYLTQPIQDNRAFQLLHEAGYTTVSFEGTLSYTQIANADVYLTNNLPLNKFESISLMGSPFEPLSNILDLKIPIPSYRTHQERVLYKFDELKKVPKLIPGPKIVYSHFLIPHPPFVFDHNGNTLVQQRPYQLWDDGETAGGAREYQQSYREQVMFANKKVIEAIDGILANSKTPPIILVMGDHGPASMFRFDIDSPGCVWERTSNLYALRLPGHQNDGTLYSTITPVNTFRVIFNTYFGTDLPLLEDRTYLAASQYHGRIKEITNNRDSRVDCFISSER